MLEIKKQPRDREIEVMRGLIKDRGSYLYYLVQAARARGVAWEDIARCGMTAFGCMKFRARFSQIQGLDDFLETYLSEETKQIFDSYLIERDENHAVIRAGYCPLMHAWVECGGDEAQVAKLCDIAMDADRAQVNSIPALSFSLRKSLAEGDDQCEFLVELCKQEEESK